MPLINLIYLIGCLHAGLFYKLVFKKEYPGYDYIDYEIAMRSARHHNGLFGIILILDAVGAILLSLSLIVINIYLTLFLILISLPFKFYPIKYLFGIIYSNNFI